MKHYSIDFIYKMLFKYIWIIGIIVILIEVIFSITTAIDFTKTSSKDIMESTNRELHNKLNVTWTLADALAKDLTITDTSISLEDRALYLTPYNETYDLFLIGLTDHNGKITSTYDNIPGDISERDYFKHSMKTGESVITDAFPAGADGSTYNYTICVPYYGKNNSSMLLPDGALIMSIPFDDVNELITGSSRTTNFMFTLLASDNKVMAEAEEDLVGSDFATLINNSTYISKTQDKVINSVHSKQSGSYWTVDSGRLLYVSYSSVERTPWMLLTSIDVFYSCKGIFADTLVKSLIMLLIFGAVSIFGKRYANIKLADAQIQLQQMEKLQNNLREEKLITSATFEELMDISKSGLIDSLTDLPTRLSIKKMIESSLEKIHDVAGMLMLIDLDDLKRVNDTYGHAVGDTAIATFGKTLKQLSTDLNGIAGRFGGDEFIAFFSSDDLVEIPQKVLNALRIELVENNIKLNIHASIGISMYPLCGSDFQTLYTLADKALYSSKRNGKNRYTFNKDL